MVPIVYPIFQIRPYSFNFLSRSLYLPNIYNFTLALKLLLSAILCIKLMWLPCMSSNLIQWASILAPKYLWWFIIPFSFSFVSTQRNVRAGTHSMILFSPQGNGEIARYFIPLLNSEGTVRTKKKQLPH